MKGLILALAIVFAAAATAEAGCFHKKARAVGCDQVVTQTYVTQVTEVAVRRGFHFHLFHRRAAVCEPVAVVAPCAVAVVPPVAAVVPSGQTPSPQVAPPAPPVLPPPPAPPSKVVPTQ